jgi:hypothetical protein
MAITPLPAAPETTDTPQQFNTKAFAWVQSLDTFVTEANAQAVDVNADAVLAEEWASKTTGNVDSTDYSAKAWAIGGTDVTDTAGRGAAREWAIKTSGTVDGTDYSAKYYADAAGNSEAAAAASAASAQATANVTEWSGSASYSAGDNVYSPVDFFTYRNKTGSNSTDPSGDPTNWELISGNVIDDATQTLSNKNLDNCTVDGNIDIGYREIPQSGAAKVAAYTLAVGDVGKFIEVGTSGAITIPDATFAAGDVISIFDHTSGDITITCTITTAYIAGEDSDESSVTLATRGVCTILFISGTVCVITGNVSV